MNPGDKVRKMANPSRVGVLTGETSGSAARLRYLVVFSDGEEFVLGESLEVVSGKGTQDPFDCIMQGRFGRVPDLRGAITFFRLSGKLANLIYSLNTTNTKFLPYQFKPVMQFLDSPSNGLLIADEVGLGKTIEAGLIWTELRARQDARRLLVVCPAMLRDKWKIELGNRFGVAAQIVDASELLGYLQEVKQNPQTSFALIVSMQGVRPSSRWDDDDEPSTSSSAQLARFLKETELDDPLLDMVVIDEAHYLRNQTTKTHLFGALLRPVTLSMVMLSATPIQLKSTDLFNLLHLLDEDAFPFEGSFDMVLKMNEPVVRLRDRILAGLVEPDEFLQTIQEISRLPYYTQSQQVRYFLEAPPAADRLASPRGRSELGDLLDRLNPLSKVVSRTLKRDVTEGRVEREAVVIKAKMSKAESAFYNAVTDKVREYCAWMDVSEGFMLTIPQRQISSCMAAACQGWLERAADTAPDDELLYELGVNREIEPVKTPAFKQKPQKAMGDLLTELVSIARAVGDVSALRQHDSKYRELVQSLSRYWKANPGRKVVLFAFYKNTLHYLAARLMEDGIDSVVVHGGLDKQQALKNFEDHSGPRILLSSEVASEGVDLQFSSLVINYDLPWNPAKIEQRIGRIDRIGQESPKILIWNFLYEETVDDRVYSRLLERLNIFERALGSMEMVLGEEIRTLSYELLSHRLTPEQEKARIDKTRVAIETVNRLHEKLEAEASSLIAHGDFIQNKVKAAQELGRYIRGDDLLAYVKDFIGTAYPGTRLLSDPKAPDHFRLDFSADARLDFTTFIQQTYLQGKTALLSANPPRLLFENRLGKSITGVERVTQDHPLVRFVSAQMLERGSSNTYFPVSACKVSMADPRFPPGVYVYALSRWTLSGSRDVERLEYVAKRLPDGKLIDGDLAEWMVNKAAHDGLDWLGASGELDLVQAAELQDECRAELEEAFIEYRDAYGRQDVDRIQQMIRFLEIHLDRKRQSLLERIQTLTVSADIKRKRILPALKGQLQREQVRVAQKIAEIRLREKLEARDTLVSSGVILVE
jgi:superfamily II DNA or RNA helicase